MPIPTLPFGTTGHVSTRTIFGAAALSRVDQPTADATLEVLLEYGVNHIDVARSYGDAELRVGAWLPKHRDRFFLATKLNQWRYEAARDQIEESRQRLQVDTIDLIQMHNLTDEIAWQNATGPNGALKAALEARDQGKVRFIGVTGHGVIVPHMHLRSLQKHPFDSILAPYNYEMSKNATYMAGLEALFDLATQRGVAIQTIKGITLGPWGDKDHTNSTWYEPLHDQADIDLAVHWVLSRPGIFLNTVGDVTLLPKVLDAASRFTGAKPTDAEMERLVQSRSMAPLFV
jgi:aryl-alcohol dehydrogenase-like predicted oxidoreductase